MSGFNSFRRRLSPKKAQLAAFIIIGILLLAMAGAIIYISTSAKKSEAEKIVEKGIEATLDEAKIREYVKACIQKEGKGLVDTIGFQGGTLNPELFRYYFNVKYNYHCVEQEDSVCESRLITRVSMANELNDGLKTKLKQCVNFDNFRKQGYQIDEGEISVKSIIGVDDVNFDVVYPVTISKEGRKIELKDYNADVASRLGMLYDLAARIVYGETTEGSFDEVLWMKDHGAEISIEKHKPYPDAVYSLKIKDKLTKKDEAFNFALKGRYTVYDIGKPSKKRTIMGYCRTMDNNCYAGMEQESCVRAGGEWSGSEFAGRQCNGLSAYSDAACEGGECKGCGSRKHGESWCEYEGLASPGFSPAGSRHYKGSCINGKIYYTECRDYREEICLENDQIEVPKAVCRINRWQDCAKQTSKGSCMENSERDCWWADYLALNRQQKCFPYIPPGFMFWQFNGAEACSMANEQFDCGYYTCGKSWVDSSALYCYFMGDCGNYRNTEGEITRQGMISTDSAPSDYVYLTDEQFDEQTKPRLKMEIESVPELDGTEFNNPHGDINRLIDNGVKYMDEVSNWKFEDFRQSYIMTGKVAVHVMHTSICMPWQAPYKGKNCDECGGPNRPCTEYKCMSLGQTCTYEEINGIGFCYDYAEKDNTPPKLFFDGSIYGDFQIKEDFFEGIEGYRIDKPLQPYAPLFFILNASEPVRCKVAALPQVGYDQMPLPSAPFFQMFYVFTDIVPKPIDFRIGLMNSIGADNFLEFGIFESYDAKFNRLVYDARKFVKEFEGPLDKSVAELHIDRAEKMWKDDIAPAIKKLFDEMGDTLRDISIQTEQGNKLIFFKCVDKAGNENEEDIFLKYRIAKDKTPPYVFAILPYNNTNVTQEFELVLYANEPANCRYAKSEMGYDVMPLQSEMSCTLPTMISFTRAYECRNRINMGNRSSMDLYIRCRDKPITDRRYSFNLTKTGEFSHGDPANAISTTLMDEGRINLTQNWEQYFNLPDVKNINVKSDENEIVINSINDPILCRYSANETQGLSFAGMSEMECKEEGPKNNYACRNKFAVPDSLFVEIACQMKFEEEERNTAKESLVLGYSRGS